MKKKLRILVTGAGGYIGSMLCTYLIKEGYKVTGIDLLKYNKNSLSHLMYHENFSFFREDVRKKTVLKKLLKDNDVIIPLAALVGAPLCKKNKKLSSEVNYIQIENILKFINKKQKLIYLNSNSGYGVGRKNKFCDEKSPLNPISHYGKTKVEAEKKILQSNHHNFICFRLATVFGYSYRMRTDLIVNFFVSESLKKQKISIFEPKFRRNFIHVRDVVLAIVFALKNFNKFKNEVYNLGLSKANLTKIQLAKKIKKYLPKTKIKIIKGIKDPDQRDYFVSNKKIEKKGFYPKISIDHGIKELVSALSLNNNYTNNY